MVRDMDDYTIRRVVIVGGGTAGWMSAAFLSKVLATTGIELILVESEDIGTVGVGEATIPPITFFNRMLGINEAEFLRRTHGTIKLGIAFDGWRRDGQRYLHPFGNFGGSIDGVSLQGFVIRALQEGMATDIWDYSLNSQASFRGRFALPDTARASPLSELAYAYHFDASLYAQFLRQYAEGRGVNRVEGRIDHVSMDAEDGSVTSVRLSDGREVAGDFFVDCSGFRALLIGEALGVGYHDWSHLLPANRAVAVPDESAVPPDPYTLSTARRAGWQWRIPLQHRTGNGYVYVSDFISDDEAAQTLLSNLKGKPLSDPRFLRFTTGRRHVSRTRNVVAIGLSSGFLEPLESTSIHFIQHGLIKLAATFPQSRRDEVAAGLYNRIMGEELDQVRDFLIAHYHLNERHGEPLWDYVRAMDIPDSLREKIALYRQRGFCAFLNQTIFQEANWLAVLWGQTGAPDGYDPLVNAISSDLMRKRLENLRRAYADVAEKLPTHEAFLRRYTGVSDKV